MRDGYAPSWGVETPSNRRVPNGALDSPTPLRSGSLRRMSRPLKLKVAGTAGLTVFQLPDQGFLGQFAGAHRKRFFPESDRGAGHVPFSPSCIAFIFPRQFSVLERNLCLFVQRHTLSLFLESYEHSRTHARTPCSGRFRHDGKVFLSKTHPANRASMRKDLYGRMQRICRKGHQ